MDPLSDVLSLIKPRNYRFGGFDLGGDWSVQFDPYQGVKCYALVSGECWLSMEGVADPVHLRAGDCFLLPSGRSFCLASDLSLKPVPPVHSFRRHQTVLSAQSTAVGASLALEAILALLARTLKFFSTCFRPSCILEKTLIRPRCVGPSRR